MVNGSLATVTSGVGHPLLVMPLDTLPDHLREPPSISLDRKYVAEEQSNLNESYHSLGTVPVSQESIGEHLYLGNGSVEIKSSGDDNIYVPDNFEPLFPFVSLASAFEMAHGKQSYTTKTAKLVVQDHFFDTNQPADIYHRDPLNPVEGQTLNMYCFSIFNPTEFKGHKTPDPYEGYYFSIASTHRTPKIELPNKDVMLRRLFVAVAFYSIPDEGAVMADLDNYNSGLPGQLLEF